MDILYPFSVERDGAQRPLSRCVADISMPWKEEATEDDTNVPIMYSYGDEKTTPPVSGLSTYASSQ